MSNKFSAKVACAANLCRKQKTLARRRKLKFVWLIISSVNSIKLYIDMLYSDKYFSEFVNVLNEKDDWWWSPIFTGSWWLQTLESGQSYFPVGEKWGDNELIPNIPEVLPFKDSVGLSDSDGLMRFSFCLRLQYQTLTTSFSMYRLSARFVISSPVGFGFMIKALSRETLTLVSIEVLFFRRRPIASGVFSWHERALAPNILLNV